MTLTFTLLAVSVTANVTLIGVIASYKEELRYLNERLKHWRHNAILRDPKTGRYVKKGR
jgi:hypothetical protein